MLDYVRTGLRAPDRRRRLADFLAAALFWRVPRPVRRALFAGDTYACPACGAQLRRFVVLHRDWYQWCPVCRSLQRHRLVALLLDRLLSNWQPARILHIAPEASIRARLRAIPGTLYISADRCAPDALLRLDLGAMQFSDGVFDLVFCSHVLEHVPDDRQAMREIRRVMSPTGKAVILVPITADETTEDPTLADPVERERRFGQHDHLRRYGPDVTQRLAEAGLQVERLASEDLVPPGELLRLGLEPGETIFVCERQTATPKAI